MRHLLQQLLGSHETEGNPTMFTRWDNIQILQAVDRHQERFGGGEVWGVDGRQLMDDVAGSAITEDRLVRGFVRELEIAAAEGYLTFTVDDYAGNAGAIRNSYPYQYLQRISHFALTVKGQDRTRGIKVIQPLPDPAEDDGRPISGILLQQIAAAIAEEYLPEQVLAFLDEADIPLDRLPLPENAPDVGADPGGFVCGVLVGLDQWGSEGRRILRGFMGAWLDDRLISGPSDDLRASLVEKFARRGWYVQDGNLVIGDAAQGKRISSPVLRDARLAALHPTVTEVAGRLFKDGHRSAAVFEAAKAVHNRVKAMTGLSGDGAGLMGVAFKTEEPRLVLADLDTQTGRDVQAGYRFLFMGSQQAIRNPSAHEPFGEMDDNEALELLGFASHLMRKLDQASLEEHSYTKQQDS